MTPVSASRQEHIEQTPSPVSTPLTNEPRSRIQENLAPTRDILVSGVILGDGCDVPVRDEMPLVPDYINLN